MMDQDHNALSLCDLIMDGLDMIANTCFILLFEDFLSLVVDGVDLLSPC